MKVLYSKNAVQALLSIAETDTANILKHINSVTAHPKDSSVLPIPGASDGRKYFICGPYYIVFKRTVFQGSTVQYVTEIFTKNDFDYYIH